MAGAKNARDHLGWSEVAGSRSDVEILQSIGRRSLQYIAQNEGDDEVAILFTSGSTGTERRFILLDFSKQIDLPRSMYRIAGTFANFSTVWSDSALGMTVIPDMILLCQQKPTPFDLSQRFAFGVTNFGSPALLTLTRYTDDGGLKFPALKRALRLEPPLPGSLGE